MEVVNSMSHYQAMQILDKVREGQHYPVHIIAQALRLTGDLLDDQ
jgi:hypothetical protein